MDIKERMDDAEFVVKVPICKYCKNRKSAKECKVVDEVSTELLFCKTNECQYFIEDEKEKTIYLKLI